MIFLTGKDADNAITRTFNIDANAFTQVEPGMFLHRVNIPGIKYAVRTIHPVERKSVSYFNEYFDALIADMIRHI